MLGTLHTDLVGPILPPSLGKSKYFMTVMDEASGASWVCFLKGKDETAPSLMKLINFVENLIDLKVKNIKSDGGTEYKNGTLQNYFSFKGIKHMVTSLYSPESNGKRRLSRHLIEGGRTNLQELISMNGEKKDYKKLWVESVNVSNYVRNRFLTYSAHQDFQGKTPYEIIYKRKPNLGNLSVWNKGKNSEAGTQKGRKV